MNASYFLLDVFTKIKYGGNQLAIFPHGELIDETLFPVIAKELNLSETVFLFPKLKSGEHPMRIFTPGMELPTAGHPTIGTAFFLAREIQHDANRPLEILLNQPIGTIKTIVRFKNNVPEQVEMIQPLPTFGKIYENRHAFAKLLSIQENDLLDFPIATISCGVPYIIVPVKSIATVKEMQFRLDVWQEMRGSLNNQFIYVFCPEAQESGHDIHGRMFAPAAGIPEDPATGSAQGPLGCYLIKYGIAKSPLLSEQGYEMERPSQIKINIETSSSGEITEVRIAGRSVFIGSGTFFLD